MGSKRDQIAMTMDEIRDYLSQNRLAILVSNRADGYPHPLPMHYVFEGDCILMHTFRKSQKVRNLERDPRCSILVETGDEEYDRIKSVIAYADVEIIDDLVATSETMRLGMARAAGTLPFPAGSSEAMIAAQAPKRVVLKFRPNKYVSWDHSKLGGQY